MASATYVDHHGVVSLAEVVEDGGLVEECQVGHVLGLLVLGRVDLLALLLGQFLLAAVRQGQGVVVALLHRDRSHDESLLEQRLRGEGLGGTWASGTHVWVLLSNRRSACS